MIREIRKTDEVAPIRRDDLRDQVVNVGLLPYPGVATNFPGFSGKGIARPPPPPPIPPMKLINSQILGILVLAHGADAQTLSYEYGLPITQNTTEIDETGFLGLFNTSLGTLTGATLTLYGEGTTEISLTNDSVSTVTARAVGSSNLTFVSDDLAPLNSLLASAGNVVILDFPTGPSQDYAPGETRTFGPLNSAVSSVYDLSSILVYLQAAGGGTFSLNAVSENTLSIIGGGGNISSSQTTVAGTGARIEYTYTAVPEPGSVMLFSLALGLPLFGRCRR